MAYEPLLAQVLGRTERGVDAVLTGVLAVTVQNGRSAALLSDPAASNGAKTHGKVIDLSPSAFAQLKTYLEATGCAAQAQTVRVGEAEMDAAAFAADETSDVPWSFKAWTPTWAKTMCQAAADFIAAQGSATQTGQIPAYSQILLRADVKVRAQCSAPSTLRRDGSPDDTEITEVTVPYRGFFSVEEIRFRHRRFEGGYSPELSRAAFISADAATVLPYDPVRDRVHLIEQFRMGPFRRHDPVAWSLEAIAGRIDAGETPKDCARREALEEAGLTLGDLIPISQYYPSPGAKSEFLFSFIGIADLPDDYSQIGGVATEDEDIRSHRVGFAQLMGLLESGEINNAPLILSVLHLARLREGLRDSASG